jgi:oligopeptide transport system ATP-binding protein
MLLRVEGLAKHYPVRRGLFRRRVGTVRAVDGLSFEIGAGETLALVGESGCGKSTTGRTILMLARPTAGRVVFDGQDLAALEPEALRRSRRHIQMVFQDPLSSLDPRLTVGALVEEPLEIHAMGSKSVRRERVGELLGLVGLPGEIVARFPHQLSGGQRQRVGIARALATGPRFLVADEPIASLDVSVQAQVVNLLMDLKEQLGLTYLFITHDLRMVRHVADRVAVMYLGRVVEIATRRALFSSPLHPYTQALLGAIPGEEAPARVLEGEPPSPARIPPGCRFHPRCPIATDICRREDPALRELGTPGEGHTVACHNAGANPPDAPPKEGGGA